MPSWCECKLSVRSARPGTIDEIEEVVRRHGPRDGGQAPWRTLGLRLEFTFRLTYSYGDGVGWATNDEEESI